MENVEINPSFWTSSSSKIFLNPRMEKKLSLRIQKAFNSLELQSTLGVASSGTESLKSGEHKIVLIKKDSFLDAARSVNHFCKINSQDVWMKCIPDYHVGGLSILARCFLVGAKVVSFSKWTVDQFVEVSNKEFVTITSLVPTQIYDLVQANQVCPKSLRLCIVGGGALDEGLYKKAVQLGWPLMLSYGMTETSAMMAGRPLASKESIQKLKLLPHIQFKPLCDDRWAIQGEALFYAYLFVSLDSYRVEEKKDWFEVDDQLLWDGRFLQVLGRSSELVKILGESVNIVSVERKVHQFLINQGIETSLFIQARPSERRGFSLKVYCEHDIDHLLSDLNKTLMPFEKIEKAHFIKKIPRNDMGKILKN